MFTKRLLGVAVACAMAGAVGIANAAPTLSIVDALGFARTANDLQVEHTGDPGGSVYPWSGVAGAGAGVPWQARNSAGNITGGWPTGLGMDADASFQPNWGTSGWHMSYLLLTEATDVTFQFMGAGDSARANSFWLLSDNPHTAAIDVGWWQMFQDGQSSNPTYPCPVTPNGATFPSCNKPFDTFPFPDANQYTIALGAGLIPFAFDVDGRVIGGVPQGPINNPTATWLFDGGTQCTGNPDTTYPNLCAGYFLGADPYLVNANHVSTGLQAVYAGLTDLPCEGGACDHDFQDMGVRISVVPEPGTLALIGVALCGLVVARTYAARASVPG